MFDARKHGFGRDEFLRVPWEFSDNKWNTMPNLVNWAFSGCQNFVVFLGAAQLFFWNSAAQCVISWRSVTLKCLDLLGGFSVFDVFLQESLKKHIQVDMKLRWVTRFFGGEVHFSFFVKLSHAVRHNVDGSCLRAETTKPKRDWPWILKFRETATLSGSSNDWEIWQWPGIQGKVIL